MNTLDEPIFETLVLCIVKNIVERSQYDWL